MDAIYTGKEIAQRRKALDMTQKELAELVHVTDKSVSKWERGLNFPDLGLLEPLAAALETTPAQLLGLEHADQNELLQSMSALSQQQLLQAEKRLRIVGWLALLLLIPLYFIYHWIPRSPLYAYQTIRTLCPLLILGGLYLLFRHGQIRSWNTLGDWGAFYLAVLPAMAWNWGYLLLGSGFPKGVQLFLLVASAIGTQLLFYRVMLTPIPRIIPLMVTVPWLAWLLAQSNNGEPYEFGIFTLACIGTYLLCRVRDKSRIPFPWKRAAVLMVVLVILFCLLIPNSLVELYVTTCHSSLESYCEDLLDSYTEITGTRYGPWRVTVYPEDGMVEFHTGGAGLAPGATYAGFYYSSENVHIPFQGADLPMEDWYGTAHWTDGTDNHGSSHRMMEKWFWFEASF